MTVQASYPATPPARAAGMVVNTFGPPQYISRPLSTRQLEQLTFGTTDGLYTVTIDGVEVANYTASTDTATVIRDAVLADLLVAGIVAEAVSTDKLIIEAPGDDASDEFVIAISVVASYAAAQLVAHASEVPFGLGLVRDDRAPAGGPRKCRLPRLATDVTAGMFLGVAASHTMSEPNAGGWPHLSMPNILRVGHIYVVVEDVGIEGAPLFLRHATGTGTQIGAFRDDADSASCVAIPGLRALESWSAGGVVAAEYFPQT